MRLIVGAGLVVAVLAPRAADACSVCGCGDPLVDVSDSLSRMDRFRLALDFERLTATAASDDDPAATEGVTQTTLRPVIVWSPIATVNVVLQVPFVNKAFTLTGGDAPLSTTNFGLGDLDLGARWYFWTSVNLTTETRQELGISAGTSMPTGADDATLDGMRLDDHAQLGTGSWGPYAGVSYAFHKDPWNVFTSLTARAHTTNSYDYHYATSLQWTLRGDYRLHDRFAVELGVDGRYAWEDTAGGDAQTNTGGLVVSLSPGFTVNVWGDVWLRARAQLPVLTSLDGEQSVGVTVFASVQVLIR
jgi:hypothetical protein